jgi:endogenous inhibitor of DNA gyrase (YacG/DUF329 family)
MAEQFDIKQSIATMHHMEIVKFPCPECGKEAEADISIVLSSYPGQYNYHCPHCGAHGSVLCSEVDNYRFNKKVWDAIGSTKLHGTKCIICGEETTFAGEIEHPYICKKCKKAVLAMRKLLEEKDD